MSSIKLNPPTADERIALIRTKIERAKHHLADLTAAVKLFTDSKPYRIGTKRDPQTRRLIYYVTHAAETPVGIALIAGDVLQCARSALDHLAYQLVLANGGTPTKRTSFPIVDFFKDYKGVRNSALAGMADSAKQAIDATRPYSDQGGNQILWRLYRLNNIDKHRIILTAGSAFQSFDIGSGMSRLLRSNTPWEVPVFQLFIRPADRLFPLKVNDVLFADLPDAEEDKEMQFRFDVAIGEPGVVDDGPPLIETLTETLDFVDNLISTFRPLL